MHIYDQLKLRLILTISPTICSLLVHHLDDVINLAFQKTENNNCIILILNYIMQKHIQGSSTYKADPFLNRGVSLNTINKVKNNIK